MQNRTKWRTLRRKTKCTPRSWLITFISGHYPKENAFPAALIGANGKYCLNIIKSAPAMCTYFDAISAMPH